MPAVKPIMGAYPFLRLANKHGLDYGDVLMFAEAHATGEPCIWPHPFVIRGVDIGKLESKIANRFSTGTEWTEFAQAMRNVSDNFRDIQQNGWDMS